MGEQNTFSMEALCIYAEWGNRIKPEDCKGKEERALYDFVLAA